MLFLSVEDVTSKMEILIFPSVLEKNLVSLEENKPILVSGRVNDRDGVIKLLCDEIKELT